MGIKTKILDIYNLNKYSYINNLKKYNLFHDFLKMTLFLNDKYNKIHNNQRLWHIKNNIFIIQKCKICNNMVDYNNKTGEYYSTCSQKCKGIMMKNTYIKNNGEYDIGSKEFMEKSKKILMEKYGVTHNSQLSTHKEKFAKSFAKSSERKFLEKMSHEYELVSYGQILKLKHKTCGNEFDIVRGTYKDRKKHDRIICTSCNSLDNYDSHNEIKLFDFINEYTNEYTIYRNIRNIIPPYELDVYIPELKLAFEFDGDYWHSEIFKPMDYHQMKSDLCLKQGIQLIHVWEHDWLHKQEIVKSIISGHLGKYERIYARRCEIVKLSAKDCREFIDNNHLQGFIGATVYYGLTYNDELVSVMLFQKKKDCWEISRLCTKLNLSVIGGTERLWKHFLRNNKIGKVITYNNRDYYTGGVYKRLGFKLEKTTEPSFWYIKNGHSGILSSRKCQKYKLVEQGYDHVKPAHEIMKERGYHRCYNSGYHKFTFD